MEIGYYQRPPVLPSNLVGAVPIGMAVSFDSTQGLWLVISHVSNGTDWFHGTVRCIRLDAERHSPLGACTGSDTPLREFPSNSTICELFAVIGVKLMPGLFEVPR